MTDAAIDAPPRSGFRAALRHRQYRLLLAAYAISGTGNWCYSVALAVWALDRTGSSAWVSAILVARVAPCVVVGPLAGVLADRVDRRRLMVALDIGCAVVVGALALVVHADGPVIVGVLITAVVGCMVAVYRPAVSASTPRVVPEDDLAAANALEAVVGQITVFIGPALASLLLVTTSPAGALLFNAATFVVSAALVSRVRAASGPPAAAQENETEPDEPAGQMFREGLRVVRRTPGLMAFVGLLGAALGAWGAEEVLKVVVASEHLGTGAKGVGWLGAALGVGGLVIAPFTARLAARPRLAPLFVGSCLLTATTVALLSLPRSLAPALVIVFFEGFAFIGLEVAAMTLGQRAVEPAMLGRLFGVTDAVNTGAMLLGAILAPLLVSAFGLDATLLIVGGALAGAALLSLPRLHALDVHTAERAGRLAPRADALGSLALFEALPRASLEELAASVREITSPAGTVVLREGDPPDDVYVVRAGTLTVTVGDEPVAALGPDDWFGEIGIVRRTPRTATVTVSSDATLWRIGGDQFLDAVQLSPKAGMLLDGTMTARLARRAGPGAHTPTAS
jgi:MFS family permease